MRHQAAIAYLGLGSNLCIPERQIGLALREISLLPRLQLQQVSRFVCSAPQGGVQSQPDFVNAVCKITTTLTAHTLLQELLVLEKQLGRVRLLQDGPRVIDLDLLLYGDVVIQEQGLIVPHPRLYQRRFVLEPLLDITPTVVIPGHGPATALLPACLGQRLEWLSTEPEREVI
ncbi:MAG TPA: 2-amino-4-hydroxy-6-hydroxymethyldihydropteridine diphosphokinase [Gammaproteobacteria bacterium]|nr:2-amino-4-hydroxy-6-hydroxymethyldihydropteridine diphosphokinase [Gammaproteobacteria bacterium]